jgi:hypothetical protein
MREWYSDCLSFPLYTCQCQHLTPNHVRSHRGMNNVPFIPPSTDEFRQLLSGTFTSPHRQYGSGGGHTVKSFLSPSRTHALPLSSLGSLHPPTKKAKRKKRTKSKLKQVKQHKTVSRKKKGVKPIKGNISKRAMQSGTGNRRRHKKKVVSKSRKARDIFD